MKKYFYSNAAEKQGPYSFEELKSKSITQETLIWYEGIDDWKLAKDIEEFNEIFELIPPPIIESKLLTKLENVKRRPNNLRNYILTIVVGCIYTIVVNQDTTGNLFYFMASTIGALLIPAGIAGLIVLFTKKQFSLVLLWTTIIAMTLSAIGSLGLQF